jgi:hypothetical protein
MHSLVSAAGLLQIVFNSAWYATRRVIVLALGTTTEPEVLMGASGRAAAAGRVSLGGEAYRALVANTRTTWA